MNNTRGRKFPWFGNNDEILARRYILRAVPDSNWYLLTPSANKFDWDFDPQDPYSEKSEASWRSCLLDNEGYEVSGGFPKFHNFGENRSEQGEYSYIDQKIAESITNKTALLTKKEDGSLIIRSVYNGQVILRTRGSYQLPQVEGSVDFDKHVKETIAEKYPNLMDPSILPDLDLLFEFVAPENRIVVVYEKSDLILLAAKNRVDQSLLSWDELKSLADTYNFTLVELVTQLNHCKTPLELKDTIDIMEREGNWPHEGIVVRSPEGFMAKIKGEEYLAQHRLKANFNYEKMVEVCEDKKIIDYDALKKYLEHDLLMDWETITGLDEMFDTYIERRAKYAKTLAEITKFVEEWAPSDSENIQKQFALQVKDKPYSSVYFAIFNYPKNSEKIQICIQKFFTKIVLEGE